MIRPADVKALEAGRTKVVVAVSTKNRSDLLVTFGAFCDVDDHVSVLSSSFSSFEPRRRVDLDEARRAETILALIAEPRCDGVLAFGTADSLECGVSLRPLSSTVDVGTLRDRLALGSETTSPAERRKASRALLHRDGSLRVLSSSHDSAATSELVYRATPVSAKERLHSHGVREQSSALLGAHLELSDCDASLNEGFQWSLDSSHDCVSPRDVFAISGQAAPGHTARDSLYQSDRTVSVADTLRLRSRQSSSLDAPPALQDEQSTFGRQPREFRSSSDCTKNRVLYRESRTFSFQREAIGEIGVSRRERPRPRL